MKVGILTYHDGLNHGAFLQAFSTMSVLKEAGHDVVIINYKNANHYQSENFFALLKRRNPFAIIGNIKKYLAFRRAQKQLSLSNFTVDPKSVLSLDLECVVVGSDVVWNYTIFGYDPLFFGQLGDIKKVAYAPSFGNVTNDSTHPVDMFKDLSNFNAISARDKNTRDIIKSGLNINVPLVLDPTLIYDFDKVTIKDRICRLKDRKYLLVYSYKFPVKELDQIKRYSSQHDLDIIAVGYPQPYKLKFCSEVHLDVDPFEWIECFRHADTILTSTFHGVVFCLKMQKPFFFITNTKAYNRVKSLLDTCRINSKIDSTDDGRIVFVQPEYSSITPHLDKIATASRSWLLSNLDNVAR